MEKDSPPPYSSSTTPAVHANVQQPPPYFSGQSSGYPYPPQAPYPGPQQPYPQQEQPYPQMPQPGAAPYPTYGAAATHTVVMPPEVIIVGGCPACRIGVLEDNYGLCALCCAIIFFPAGILCCLLMKERRCSHCGAVFN